MDKKLLKQIAKERKVKFKLFSDIVEKSPDGVQIVDLDGRVIYSNRAVEEIYGFSREDIKGKHVNEMNVDPEFAQKEIIPTVKKTGRWEGELLEKHKNRKIFPIWLAAFIVNDNNGHPIGIIGIIRDLTGFKLAEKTIKDKEKFLEDVLNSIQDGVSILDKDMNILRVNPPVEKWYSHAMPLIGKKCYEAYHEKKRRCNICPSYKSLKTGEASYKVVPKRGAKSDIVGWLDLYTFPLVETETGKINGVIEYVRDITERRKAEEELKKHRERLEDVVKELTRELLETNENLKTEVGVRKKVEKKLLEYQKHLQLLASQISLIEEREKRRIANELHDCIGQSLALSKIKLGFLNKKAPSTKFKNTIKEILELIENSIKETRTLTFELSPPILYELGLSQAIKWLIDQFREKHSLEITLEDEDLDIPFDHNIRFFLFQAVRELLINIVKHAQASKAKIKMSINNNKPRISVEDNGIGFANSSVKNIGYGLFNIRERMNHISGRFQIKSKPGSGTRVILVAPFNPDKRFFKRIQYEN